MTRPTDTQTVWPQETHHSIIFCLCAALTACYPQLGQRAPDDPATLLAAAQEACARQDRFAARNIASQLVTRHPDAPQAAPARAYLTDDARCATLEPAQP
jgi:hypothetical protein